MNIPQDYHVHTTFSPDGHAAPEELCRRAIQLGIPEIGFSEHWDVIPHEKDTRHLQPGPWYAEIERLRGLFAGQLTLRAGIEIGEPHIYREDTAWILAQAPFDYVLGSVHYVGAHLMFDESYFRRHGPDEVYGGYFAELEKMARVADVDILAHFDVPARTAKPILGYEPARYEIAIRSVLKVAIERGLALDVNVAGKRKPSQVLSPDPLILGWYRQMGGERLTLGSDTHDLGHLGLHLDGALAAIQAAGFTHVTQFERRKARQIPL
ncbi:MAG TPA: histidinol-phosphatase HisJ family protein [Anaerolineales bacterium]|nr:histidinol-phosphatase HisJ family protein [Anaerolineales bacterium]